MIIALKALSISTHDNNLITHRSETTLSLWAECLLVFHSWIARVKDGDEARPRLKQLTRQHRLADIAPRQIITHPPRAARYTQPIDQIHRKFSTLLLALFCHPSLSTMYFATTFSPRCRMLVQLPIVYPFSDIQWLSERSTRKPAFLQRKSQLPQLIFKLCSGPHASCKYICYKERTWQRFCGRMSQLVMSSTKAFTCVYGRENV